ncbi:LysR family transcriptional regulator [Paracoccus onubensis]|uniref:LysR family transcriptional regulator n=1 Tax=Paracoccus onubensis TaxID=1675788 RepID=UPI002730F3DE|nr:LysR family transcriptional regulator [Paracoccus onubensis]MDP0926522.1 LysR family transcriptional regulator [Paracoccus onubensis]
MNGWPVPHIGRYLGQPVAATVSTVSVPGASLYLSCPMIHGISIPGRSNAFEPASSPHAYQHDRRRTAGEDLRGYMMTEDGLSFDLRPLRYVLAAHDELSFSRAARVLGMRVSTISRNVRSFEDEIGVSLFERTTSGVRLTDAGRRFLGEIVPALQMIESALQHAGAAGRVEEGTVRIGIITTLAGGFLRDLITSFRQAFDGVHLAVVDGGRREHLRALRSRELDMVFLTGNDQIGGCDVFELWRERVHVALAADHPFAGKDALDWSHLRDEQFIISTHDPGPEVHDYIIRRIADYSTYPSIAYRPVIQETLMHMVAIGEGITVVSEGWTSMAFPGLALVPLTAEEDIIPFSAIWSPDNDNPALRRFISFAKVLSSKRRDDLSDQ